MSTLYVILIQNGLQFDVVTNMLGSYWSQKTGNIPGIFPGRGSRVNPGSVVQTLKSEHCPRKKTGINTRT